MVCLICLAVIAALSAAILTPDVIDKLTSSLRSKLPDVEKVTDSKSVTKWMGTYTLKAEHGSVAVPVAIYAFKDYKRVRIQVLTHDLKGQQVEFVQDEICAALGATVLSREWGQEAGVHTDHPEPTETEGPRTEPQSRPNMPGLQGIDKI